MTSGGVGGDLWPKRRGRKAGEARRKKEREPDRVELKAVDKEIPWTAIEEVLMYRKRGFFWKLRTGRTIKGKVSLFLCGTESDLSCDDRKQQCCFTHTNAQTNRLSLHVFLTELLTIQCMVWYARLLVTF